jgi:hypothetical protein
MKHNLSKYSFNPRDLKARGIFGNYYRKNIINIYRSIVPENSYVLSNQGDFSQLLNFIYDNNYKIYRFGSDRPLPNNPDKVRKSIPKNGSINVIVKPAQLALDSSCNKKFMRKE